MRLAIAVPESHVSAEVLNAGLEALTRLDERLIEQGSVPTFRKAVAAGQVVWKPEPPGDERFDHAAIVHGRGWGDCDDLAPWHAAGLRASGEDPDATAVVYRSGPSRWHAVVQRGDGSIQDPSKAAGMGGARGVVVGIAGAVVPSLYGASVSGDARPAIRVAQRGPWWNARADTPWANTAYGMTALNQAAIPNTALTGAILGCCAAAQGLAEPEHLAALLGVAFALDGYGFDEVADIVGDDAADRAADVVENLRRRVNGLNFGKVFHALEPLTSKLISFVPGIGPIASTALDVTSQFIPGGGPRRPISIDIPGVPKDVVDTALDVQSALAPHHFAPPMGPMMPRREGWRPGPLPPPPGQHMPGHVASMQAFPGGPFVVRF